MNINNNILLQRRKVLKNGPYWAHPVVQGKRIQKTF